MPYSNKNKITYYFLRVLCAPSAFMPYKLIHLIGKVLGFLAYFILKNYRKKTLSNLALAKDLNLTLKKQKKIAIQSFQNLAINLLEYSKFALEKDFSKAIQCINPQKAKEIYDKGQGIIFFCGHQSNWEVLFLDGTSKMKGTAIGRPIYNHYLYDWITSIREKNGGKIIDPKQALRTGLKDLKKGIFLGIVGDQGMPNSGYSYPFLGRKAWTSSAPALLAYKTNSPIIVATTNRKFGKYEIHYSDPIWPDVSQDIKKEVPRLMDLSLKLFENSVTKNPGQWFWQHNRWKQQLPNQVKRKYRHESIAIFLPKEKKEFENIYPHLQTLKKIYPDNFLFLFIPKKYKHLNFIETEEKIFFSNYKQLLKKDYRFKLIFNFTSFKQLKKHYLKQCCFHVEEMHKIVSISQKNPSKTLIEKICHPKLQEKLLGELVDA